MKYLVLLLCLFGLAFAEWHQLERADKYHELSIRFALKQKNINILERTLLDVADPASKNYGKWWKTSDILDLVSPPMQVSQNIVTFLSSRGGMKIENRRDVIICRMQVKDIESLLQTEMSVFAHSNGLNYVVRTKEGYTIPSEISQYVDFVSGVVEFPEPRKPALNVNAVPDGYVTVGHIQEVYNIPTSFPNHPDSTIAVIEFQDDKSYSEADLQLFVKEMAIPNITVTHVVGPFNGSYPDAESTLDVQYGGAIALNASVWFWTELDWMYEFTTDLQNTTNPPLVVSMSWGWPEPMQCQVDPSQCSNGTSSGTSESYAYVDRVNVEFMKIGLSGITLIAASGDQGAPGDADYDCSNSTSPFSTIFPGASPWVLSVGATMLNTLFEESVTSSNPPICSQVKCTAATREEACSFPDALITTGGGFSNLSPRPSFQDNAINNYFSSGVKLPDSSFFNKSNRGFPDVSALGHNYIIAYDGQFGGVDGTSCSAPVWGGIVTLLNSYRLNNKKASLGYIVPLIYSAYAADPTTFKDITKGDNKCTESCCVKEGYDTAKGWDPVTGLGTPQFPELLSYVKSLKN